MLQKLINIFFINLFLAMKTIDNISSYYQRYGINKTISTKRRLKDVNEGNEEDNGECLVSQMTQLSIEPVSFI